MELQSGALIGWRHCEDDIARTNMLTLKVFSSVKAHHRII